MLAQATEEIFRAFILGSLAVIIGGAIFENGRKYVKTSGNQFKGKVEALPFFFATLVLGYILQHIEPQVDSIVYAFPPLTRVGMIGVSTMLLFNYSVDEFNYGDKKSSIVYTVFFLIGIYPYTGLQL